MRSIRLWAILILALATRALDAWCRMAEEVDHPPMTRFIKMLRKYESDILNRCAISAWFSTVPSKVTLARRASRGSCGVNSSR